MRARKLYVIYDARPHRNFDFTVQLPSQNENFMVERQKQGNRTLSSFHTKSATDQCLRYWRKKLHDAHPQLIIRAPIFFSLYCQFSVSLFRGCQTFMFMTLKYHSPLQKNSLHPCSLICSKGVVFLLWAQSCKSNRTRFQTRERLRNARLCRWWGFFSNLPRNCRFCCIYYFECFQESLCTLFLFHETLCSTKLSTYFTTTQNPAPNYHIAIISLIPRGIFAVAFSGRATFIQISMLTAKPAQLSRHVSL